MELEKPTLGHRSRVATRLAVGACLFVAGFSIVAACGGHSTSTTIPNSQRPHITTTIGGTVTTVVTGP